MEKFVNQDTPKQKESSNKEIVDVCNENDGCFWKNITNDTNLGDTIGKESKLPAYTNGHNACEIKSSRCDSDEVQELDSSVSSYLFSNSAISPNPPLSKPTLAKSSTPFLFNTNFSFECFQLSGKQSTPPEESLQGSLALSVAEQETPSEANRDKAQESFVKETQFASPLVQESVKEIQHKQLFADPKDLEDSLYLFVASPPLSCSEHSDKGNDFLAQDNDNKTNSASGHFKFNTIISIDPNLNHNNNDKNDSTDSNINNNNNTNTEIYYNNDRNNSNEINNSNDKNNINENNNDNNKNSDINNNNEPATPKLLTRDKFEKSQASEGHFTSTENPVNQNGHHIELKSTTTTCVSHTIRVSCCGTSFTREYEENPLVRVSKKVGFLPGRLCICHLTGPSLLSSPNFHFQKEQLENFIKNFEQADSIVTTDINTCYNNSNTNINSNKIVKKSLPDSKLRLKGACNKVKNKRRAKRKNINIANTAAEVNNRNPKLTKLEDTHNYNQHLHISKWLSPPRLEETTPGLEHVIPGSRGSREWNSIHVASKRRCISYLPPAYVYGRFPDQYYYVGTVEHVDEETGECRVQFTDGDIRQVKPECVYEYFVIPPGSNVTLRLEDSLWAPGVVIAVDEQQRQYTIRDQADGSLRFCRFEDIGIRTDHFKLLLKRSDVKTNQPFIHNKREKKREKLFGDCGFIITGGSLPDNQKSFCKNHIENLIKLNGGKLFNNFSERFALKKKRFLVTDTPRRSLKYMEALVRGVPCVDFSWITTCCRKSRFVAFEDFVLPRGLSVPVRNVFPLKILKETTFTLFGSRSFKNEWKRLLLLCNGTFVSIELVSQGLTFFIVEKGKVLPKKYFDLCQNNAIQIVTSEYIIQSIVHGKLLNINANEDFAYR